MKWIASIIRYILGIVMFAYGYVKVVNFQFSIPDSLKLIPIRDADGVTLTFSFFGYSAWFSVLLGIAELVPTSTF
jgi:hypothetical protein